MFCGRFLGLGSMFGHRIFGGITMMILFFVLAVFIIYLIYKVFTGKEHNTQHSENDLSAIEILNKQFALGKINEAEYLKKKNLLKK